jgi:hypothetical protein
MVPAAGERGYYLAVSRSEFGLVPVKAPDLIGLSNVELPLVEGDAVWFVQIAQ